MVMIKADLINYFDVWAGEEGTWEVNNLCKEGTIELPGDFTDKQLLQELKDFGFIKEEVTMDQIEFEDLGEFGVEFRQADNGYLIGRIEFLEH